MLALGYGVPKLTLKQLTKNLRFEMLNLEIVGGTNTREDKMNELNLCSLNSTYERKHRSIIK